MSVSVVFAPTASAQTSSDPAAAIEQFAPDFNLDQWRQDLTSGAEEQAWQTRQLLVSQATAVLNPMQSEQLVTFVDGILEGIFPGIVGRHTPKPEAAPAPAPAPAPSFDTGSCPASADVCVDQKRSISWLQDNGRVTYGPVNISAGAPTPEDATPNGTFHVTRKVRDEISYEFNNAPMPFAIYFTNNGHAFHEGSPQVLSNGCVHLNHNDAVKYFDDLQIGDTVYIF
ncbi:L,D-transpeptidase [Corynebacterium tapiri]